MAGQVRANGKAYILLKRKPSTVEPVYNKQATSLEQPSDSVPNGSTVYISIYNNRSPLYNSRF